MSSLHAPSSDACLLHLQDQYCFEMLMKHTILKAALPCVHTPKSVIVLPERGGLASGSHAMLWYCKLQKGCGQAFSAEDMILSF